MFCVQPGLRIVIFDKKGHLTVLSVSLIWLVLLHFLLLQISVEDFVISLICVGGLVKEDRPVNFCVKSFQCLLPCRLELIGCRREAQSHLGSQVLLSLTFCCFLLDN